MPETTAIAPLLTRALAVLMLMQALMGLLFQGQYRDVEWIKATWFGNDWVTLLLAVPLLLIGLIGATRGSVRGLLLWLGVIGYAVYNYAFYLFGAALNAFFPIYVVALVLAVTVLILALSHIDAPRFAHSVRPTAPVRLLGGSLVFIAIGLASAWIAMWAAYVFAGRGTPVEPEAFKLVAALDLSLMVPVLAVGGVLIWRRMPWGFDHFSHRQHPRGRSTSSCYRSTQCGHTSWPYERSWRAPNLGNADHNHGQRGTRSVRKCPIRTRRISEAVTDAITTPTAGGRYAALRGGCESF